jgi:hypothetical protein
MADEQIDKGPGSIPLPSPAPGLGKSLTLDSSYQPFGNDNIGLGGNSYSGFIDSQNSNYLPVPQPLNSNIGGGSLYDKEYSDLLNSYSNSKPSISSQVLAGSVKYDIDSDKMRRYEKSDYWEELGYNPYWNPEELYGQRQTKWNALSNGVGGAWQLLKSTHVEGWKGWGYMWDAARTMDYKALMGSEGWEELAKKQKQIMDDYAIFQTEYSENTIFNKQLLGNFVQQSGFALGAISQVMAEQYMLHGAALAMDASIGGLAAGITTHGIAAAKGMATIGRLMKGVKAVNDIWKDANVARKLYKAAASMDIAKGGQALWKGTGSFKRFLSEANAAMTEARMEAAMTYGDMVSGLASDFEEQYGYKPGDKELAAMNKVAMMAGSDNFAINSVVIGAMNRLAFDNVFSKFGSSVRFMDDALIDPSQMMKVTGKIKGDKVTQYYRKSDFGKLGRYKAIANDFGTLKAMKEAGWSALGMVGKIEGSEGFQELIQESSNVALTDYYTDVYKLGKGDLYSSWMKGADEQFSKQGFKTFMMGALTGRLIAPFTYAIGKTKDLTVSKAQRKTYNTQLDSNLSFYNVFLRDYKKILNEDVKGLSLAEKDSKSMIDALKDRDKYKFFNARDSALSNAFYSATITNTMDMFVDTLKSYHDSLTEEELKEAFGHDIDSSMTDSVKGYISGLMSYATDYVNNTNKIRQEMRAPVSPSKFKVGTKEHMEATLNKTAYDSAVGYVAGNMLKVKQTRKRYDEMLSELSTDLDIKDSAFTGFSTLSSQSKVEQELDTLKHEIKSSVDPKIKAQKERQLEALENFQEIFSDSPFTTASVVKRRRAMIDYINSINAQNDIKIKMKGVTATKAFEGLLDLIKLNQDNLMAVEAISILAEPDSFGSYVNRHDLALKKTIEDMYETLRKETEATAKAEEKSEKVEEKESEIETKEEEKIEEVEKEEEIIELETLEGEDIPEVLTVTQQILVDHNLKMIEKGTDLYLGSMYLATPTGKKDVGEAITKLEEQGHKFRDDIYVKNVLQLDRDVIRSLSDSELVNLKFAYEELNDKDHPYFKFVVDQLKIRGFDISSLNKSLATDVEVAVNSEEELNSLDVNQDVPTADINDLLDNEEKENCIIP